MSAPNPKPELPKPPTEAALEEAAKTLLESVVGLAKRELSRVFGTWHAQRRARDLRKRIQDIRRVKTIWQPEKAVDLLDFYYPSRVMEGRQTIRSLRDQGGKRLGKIVTAAHELSKTSSNVIVRGTVGQGKSILLRYLTSQEVFLKRSIPIFIELRRVTPTITIEQLMLKEMESLGLKVDAAVLGELAKTGKLTLFCDGFDEVDPSVEKAVVDELELLARVQARLRIYVSSRPDSAIIYSGLFDIVDLAPLAPEEYKEVIHRLASPRDAAQIVDAVQATERTIASLLTTPLMIVLLLIRFRIQNSLPENETAFFSSLFELLLDRHDGTKPGYRRPRKTGLNSAYLRALFDCISFLVRKEGSLGLTKHEFLLLLQKAGTHAQVPQFQPVDALTDFVKITSLLNEDGHEVRFVHKSILEYHSASFIASQPDAFVLRFYEAIRSRWSEWRQELKFLREIDEYRFIKHFELPDIENILKASHELSSDDFVGGLYEGIELEFKRSGDSFTVSSVFHHYPSTGSWAQNTYRSEADLWLWRRSLVMSTVSELIAVEPTPKSLKVQHSKGGLQTIRFAVGEVFGSCGSFDSILRATAAQLTAVLEKRQRVAREMVERRERNIELVQLFD